MQSAYLELLEYWKKIIIMVILVNLEITIIDEIIINLLHKYHAFGEGGGGETQCPVNIIQLRNKKEQEMGALDLYQDKMWNRFYLDSFDKCWKPKS